MDGNTKKKNKTAFVLIALSIIALFAAYVIFDIRFIHNPLTPQQFVVSFDTNMFLKGKATYYRRFGPILYEKKTTEYGDILPDDEMIIVQRDSIFVSAEFLGGMDYEIHNDYIDLKREPVIEWVITHENFNNLESFTLEKEDLTLEYYNFSTKASNAVTLSEERFNELTNSLRRLPLENYPEYVTDYRYELGIKLKSTKTLGPQYNAIVDAEEEWKLIANAYEEAGGSYEKADDRTWNIYRDDWSSNKTEHFTLKAEDLSLEYYCFYFATTETAILSKEQFYSLIEEIEHISKGTYSVYLNADICYQIDGAFPVPEDGEKIWELLCDVFTGNGGEIKDHEWNLAHLDLSGSDTDDYVTEEFTLRKIDSSLIYHRTEDDYIGSVILSEEQFIELHEMFSQLLVQDCDIECDTELVMNNEVYDLTENASAMGYVKNGEEIWQMLTDIYEQNGGSIE